MVEAMSGFAHTTGDADGLQRHGWHRDRSAPGDGCHYCVEEETQRPEASRHGRKQPDAAELLCEQLVRESRRPSAVAVPRRTPHETIDEDAAGPYFGGLL